MTFNGWLLTIKDILLWKETFIGRQTLKEDELWWKTILNRRGSLMEDNLQWKPLMEYDLQRTTVFGGRLTLMTGYLLYNNNCNKNLSLSNQMKGRKLIYYTRVLHWRANSCSQTYCQAQPKPASQSPAWGWDSLIIKLILGHPPHTITFWGPTDLEQT